jgi:hypothetical protein
MEHYPIPPKVTTRLRDVHMPWWIDTICAQKWAFNIFPYSFHKRKPLTL